MSAPPTIFALSTAPGRAAIAVFRVSGTRARTVLAEIAGIAAPAPRRAARARLRDPATGETLDDGIAIWFPGPASYTGEDMAELQVHGGRAVVEAVGLALGRIDGLSPAEPGAFTRRAFFAGKLDLTRIEALADLVAAETEAQRRQAQRQAGGALARLYDGWRERLLRCLAHVEAAIDFPDEDLPDGIDETVRAELGALRAALDAHLADGGRGERLRAGVQVAILGPPNAGKSTLFNRLAGREAAIVSAEAGTTRDVLEVHLDLGGYPALLADTAGLRRTGGAVEAEGVARARARAETADLRLVLLDACAWPEIPRGLAALVDDDAVVAANKVDLAALPEGAALRGRPVLAVSALTGAGLDELVHALTAGVAAKAALGAEPAPTRLRHRLALEACRGSLARAVSDAEIALRAEDLRAALAALGRITGRVDVEDVLDAVFAEFCIGK